VSGRPEQTRDRMKRRGWSLACYGTGQVCVVEAYHEPTGVLILGRGPTDGAAWKDASDLDVAGGVAASGVGPEGRGERSEELLEAGGHAPQQARVDLGVVEQLTKPGAEPALHRTPPGVRYPPGGFVPNALRPVRRGTQ
jgi:hypothetical protein